MQSDAQTQTVGSENKVVLFLDLLGFASLTEQNVLELDRIKIADRPLSWNLEMMLGSQENPLTRAFTGFHRSLKSAIDLAQLKHPLTAITFSDSAFIATSCLFQAVDIAIYLIPWLMQQRIPARAGIAYGSFAEVRFRSDVTVDGGDHSAHFLGTAVVRSHATESCGIKGMRILLHPSAISLLKDPVHNPQRQEKDQIQCVECSNDETKNTVGVVSEIDYWHLKITTEKETWHALQNMWSASPSTVLQHYEATAAAINRMRIGQGKSPLDKLRRRNLPSKAYSHPKN